MYSLTDYKETKNTQLKNNRKIINKNCYKSTENFQDTGIGLKGYQKLTDKIFIKK